MFSFCNLWYSTWSCGIIEVKLRECKANEENHGNENGMQIQSSDLGKYHRGKYLGTYVPIDLRLFPGKAPVKLTWAVEGTHFDWAVTSFLQGIRQTT